MGWFGFGGGSGDTSGQTMKSSSSETLDLSGGSYDEGFSSKKRSSSYAYGETDIGSSSNFDSSAAGGDVRRRILMEQQRLQLMAAIHRINDVCWDTCIDSVSTSLSSRQENCIRNCSDRFLDATLLLTNRYAQLYQKVQGGGFR